LDHIFQLGRKPAGCLLQRLLHSIGGRHRVSARGEINGQADAGTTVDPRLTVEVLRANLDAGDVADVKQRRVLVGAQDDLAEVLRSP
jgi:hypothetical protein